MLSDRDGVLNLGTNTIQLTGITADAVGQGSTTIGGVGAGFVLTAGSIIVADSGSTPGLIINLPITSAGGIVKTGDGTLVLNPTANDSFTTTTVTEGSVTTGGNAVTVFPGNLTIGQNNVGGPADQLLRLGAPGQIASSASVTINNDGWLDLNGNADTIAGLTMTSGLLTTGAATLTLNGNVVGTAFANNISPAVIEGNSSNTVAGRSVPGQRQSDLHGGGRFARRPQRYGYPDADYRQCGRRGLDRHRRRQG